LFSRFSKKQLLKLMNAKIQFKHNKLRSQIALQEAIKSWQPDIQAPIECPLCNSTEVRQRMRFRNGNIYICRSCDQNFSEELLSGCRCWYPGRLQKCQNCPLFQSILPLVKDKVSSLRSKSLQELEQVLAKPTLYERDFSPYSPS
jgi:transposase-like protein